MSIKFRQGWTDFCIKTGDIQFFRISWDCDHFFKWDFWCALEITVLNFSIQIDIG